MIIQVLTTTRADYGVIRPIVRAMMDDKDIDVELLVSGTHLSAAFGNTLQEIIKDGIPITAKIPIIDSEEGDSAISRIMGNAMTAFGTWFTDHKPDALLVDGDRYETLAIAIAAVNANIPVLHLGGGATTEGAADEYYRHTITKLSFLHFATIETYRKRIIQMGESPERVFLTGSPLIDTILATDFMNREELEESLQFKLDMPFSVVTFHPVTLEKETAYAQISELTAACAETTDMKFIFTMANADYGGTTINRMVKAFADRNDKVLAISSLGSRRYLSALRLCEFVMGNSSSGIIEAPSFHVPTINIGDRQKGRIQAKSVINCEPIKCEILTAIRKARSVDFKKNCKLVVNPNGDGKSINKILTAIKNTWKSEGFHLKKTFFDIPYEVGDELEKSCNHSGQKRF